MKCRKRKGEPHRHRRGRWRRKGEKRNKKEIIRAKTKPEGMEGIEKQENLAKYGAGLGGP